MARPRPALLVVIAALAMALLGPAGCGNQSSAPGPVSVRDYGAVGEGATLDSPAINRAIAAQAARGGGTVILPAGNYLCFSIHLQSNIALRLDAGATIIAADADIDPGSYDSAEPNDWDSFQDFGHSHWHNSLIWGENLENIEIAGPGRIFGRGLTRDTPLHDGIGNKSIALKNCRNVILHDFTILRAGHFGILATGVDNLAIENLKIDTNRDGMNIDCCHNVRIAHCAINSPFDDGICLKSTHSLGYPHATEDVTITNCQLSGYDVGTLLDGSRQRTAQFISALTGGRGGPCGRIKFGTESNGGFRNVAISNCVFDYCRGLALEIVDGGTLEDVTISNITMRDVAYSALFIRLGDRARGPVPPGTQPVTSVWLPGAIRVATQPADMGDAASQPATAPSNAPATLPASPLGPPPGIIRRLTISHLNAYNVDHRYAAVLIAGLPGHNIDDVSLSDIRLVSEGGGEPELAATQPDEDEQGYPEPNEFGELPAFGFFVRHASHLSFRDVNLTLLAADARPPIVLDDVHDLELRHVSAPHPAGSPLVTQSDCSNITTSDSP